LGDDTIGVDGGAGQRRGRGVVRAGDIGVVEGDAVAVEQLVGGLLVGGAGGAALVDTIGGVQLVPVGVVTPAGGAVDRGVITPPGATGAGPVWLVVIAGCGLVPAGALVWVGFPAVSYL